MTVEEDLSEEMVVFDIPNDIEDQLISQGSASIERGREPVSFIR